MSVHCSRAWHTQITERRHDIMPPCPSPQDEPWLQALLAFHCVLLIVTILWRRVPVLQAAVFFISGECIVAGCRGLAGIGFGGVACQFGRERSCSDCGGPSGPGARPQAPNLVVKSRLSLALQPRWCTLRSG